MLYNLFCANIYLNAGNKNITKKLIFIDAHSSKLERNLHPSCIWLLVIRSNALSTSLLRFYGILSHRLGIQRTTATKRTTIETLKKIQQLSIFGRHKTGPIFINIFKDHSHADGTPFSQFRNKTFWRLIRFNLCL